jgi:hypothetical protein
MNNYDLAIIMLTDSLIQTLPSNTDYLDVKEKVRISVCKAIQTIRYEMEE